MVDLADLAQTMSASSDVTAEQEVANNHAYCDHYLIDDQIITKTVSCGQKKNKIIN